MDRVTVFCFMASYGLALCWSCSARGMILLDTDHTTFLTYPDSERARGEKAMQTIRALEKTGKDGMLSLRIPLGKPETEYEVLVVVQPRATAATPDERGWPPGYFDLAGSIDDETFVRPPQGEMPRPVDLD